MDKSANSKSLAINLPIDRQYLIAERSIKKDVNQEWFIDFIYDDPDTHEYLFDTCDVTFIGNMAYIAMFCKEQKARVYAKSFLDNLKIYHSKNSPKN